MPKNFNILSRTFLVVVVLMGMAGMAPAQTIDLVFRVTSPDSTAGLSIFIAGNFQGWNPGAADYQLDDLGEGLYEISLTTGADHWLKFKFTQGSWADVEKGPEGEELSNRSLHAGVSGTHTFTIESWAGQHPDAKPDSTITGDVKPIAVPDFLDGRDVMVYLPPGYHDSLTTRFPVLYMFDGQNVFDASTSFAGEWKVDETCEDLISQGRMRPIIVVAIANGGQQRINEYTPWPDDGYQGGKNGGGGQHLESIVNELLPYINHTYRTLEGPENTGLAGSSLGGLMALYASGKHQQAFGLVAGLSPSLWWKNSYPMAFAAEHIKPGVTVYLDMGGMEGDLGKDSGSYSLDMVRQLKAVLESSGFIVGKDLWVVEDASGEHNEASWARRFPGVLEFLFPMEQ